MQQLDTHASGRPRPAVLGQARGQQQEDRAQPLPPAPAM